MIGLPDYLDQIVEPTLADFDHNPRSGRHAFLACVAAFHSIDRVSQSGNVKKAWVKESMAFLIVDMVCHHFKHVRSDYEKQVLPKDVIPLVSAVFGRGGEPEALGLDLHNLRYVIREAIKFIRTKA